MVQSARTTLALVCLLACYGEGIADAQAPSGQRRPVAGTLVAIRGAASERPAELKRPGLLAYGGQLAYVYDYGDGKLKAIDRSGRLRWSAGGSGAFANPTDLHVTPTGEVWILDAPRRRLAVFSRDGRMLRSLQVGKGIARFAPKSDGSFVGLQIPGAEVLGHFFDKDGQAIRPIAMPSFLAPVGGIARELFAAPIPASDAFATIQYYSDYLTIWRGTQGASRAYRGIEPVRFANVMSWSLPDGGTAKRVAPNATRAGVAVTADSTSIYVLFAGAGPMAYRSIDVYSIDNGRYQGTYTLSRRATAIAKTPDGFVVLSGGNTPALEWLRRQARSRTSQAKE